MVLVLVPRVFIEEMVTVRDRNRWDIDNSDKEIKNKI